MMKIKKLHNKTLIAIYILTIIVLAIDYIIITAPLPTTTAQPDNTSTMLVEPSSGIQETTNFNPQLTKDVAELQGGE